MRILIMNDTSKVPHHGCIATSQGLRALVRERFPDASIQARPVRTRRVLEFLPVRTIERQFARNSGFLKDAAPDLLIVNGEGSLHAGGRKIRSRSGAFLFRLLEAERAMDLGSDAWIVNHSLYATRPDYMEVVRRVYPRLGRAAVREPLSLETFRRLALPEPVQAADCAFLADPLAGVVAEMMNL